MASRMSQVSLLAAALMCWAAPSARAAPGASPFDFVSLAAGSGPRAAELAQQEASAGAFEPTRFKNVFEAIRAHPELRLFASLCEQDEVRELLSLGRTPLTVFAPLDAPLAQLLQTYNSSARSQSRVHKPLNLLELARHHIAQGYVAAAEADEFASGQARQFYTYALHTPVYLNQLPAAPGERQQALFANNARVLATHLVPIDADRYQVLHVVDAVLEYSFVSRQSALPGGAGRSKPLKRGLTLDDLYSREDGDEFCVHGETFLEVRNGSPEAQLQQLLTGPGGCSSMTDSSLGKLGGLVRRSPRLRGRLFNLNESAGQLNTYFLPVEAEALRLTLDRLRQAPAEALASLLDAHVVPNKVLFTRVMGLGTPVSSATTAGGPLFASRPPLAAVQLSLAKVAPESAVSRAPLLVQAECAAGPEADAAGWLPGLTSALVLAANIPVSTGVLHLIERPLVATDGQQILDLVNDNRNSLSDQLDALGSRSASLPAAGSGSQQVRTNRFRELLARQRFMLAMMSSEPERNFTLLVPSDQAFGRLRYDLRALVLGDESLVPQHWDASYRNDLLSRLVKQHVLPNRQLASGEMVSLAAAAAAAAGGSASSPLAGSGPQTPLNDRGKPLEFSLDESGALRVSSDGSSGQLLQRDLVASNGILHVIDRVLGEPEETVQSLLDSMRLKLAAALAGSAGPLEELAALVERSQAGSAPRSLVSSQQPAQGLDEASSAPAPAEQQPRDPRLEALGQTLASYLEEPAGRRLELLAAGVNISCALARALSREGPEADLIGALGSPERHFTYFVPSDLAWLRLARNQPELYEPLMSLVAPAGAQAGLGASAGAGVAGGDAAPPGPAAKPRASESSQRLRQVLERHLVVNRKVSARELGRLDSLRTLGATVRLVRPSNSQIQPGAAAIVRRLEGELGLPDNAPLPGKALQLDSAASAASSSSLASSPQAANVVAAHEAPNGFVYLLDAVLLEPEDAHYILQTSQAPQSSSAMSSLLAGRQSAILDFLHSLVAPLAGSAGPGAHHWQAPSYAGLIGALGAAIATLSLLALLLLGLARRRKLAKLAGHRQLESGLASSSASSAASNSGSTSTTKSL